MYFARLCCCLEGFGCLHLLWDLQHGRGGNGNATILSIRVDIIHIEHNKCGVGVGRHSTVLPDEVS